jgi:transmembrane sensor
MTQKPDKERLYLLAEKWVDGTISNEEKQEFADWYNQFTDEVLEMDDESALNSVKNVLFEQVKKRIRADESPAQPRQLRPWLRYAAAAALLFAIAGGAYLYLRQKTGSGPVAMIPAQHDIIPGSNKAVLTLGNGQKVILDSAAQDTVLREGAAIVANANGRLAYNTGNSSGPEIVYNTLSTPRGGQYQLILPDGTRVWLNAASTLVYPTTFGGKERAVQLKGEGYFEVAHDAARPFMVASNGVTVEVLGTHFDINAYNDDDVTRTTLLEGSVMIHLKDQARQIYPGQQAKLTTGSNNINISKVDTEAVMAWKNGLFDFNQAGLAQIMRQLSRWYDVTVVYDGGKVPQLKFGGEIGRDLNLSQVLAVLEQAHVHFKIEGRTLRVLP